MLTICLSPSGPVQSGGRVRRLVLVDIENAIGGAVFSSNDVRGAQILIENLVGSIANEPVTVGVSHMSLFAVHDGWRSARKLVQSGPDGADLQLIDELSHDDIPARFNELVLVSGDGIFTDIVAHLSAQGVKVIVVAPSDGCSKRLEMAANMVLKFDRIVSKGDAA